jgi:hypothetical protein
VLTLIYLITLLHSTARAGSLESFEKELAKPAESAPSDTKRHHHHQDKSEESFFGAFFGEIFVRPLLYVMGSGGSISVARASGDDTVKYEVKPRQAGEALIPFVRLDSSYQFADSSVTAIDIRGEAGYGPLAVQIRNTNYSERNPADALRLTQVHALYRMSAGDKTEIDLGLGFVDINRHQSLNGLSITLPLLVHPSDFWGIEFRPTWSFINEQMVRDYDLSLMAGWRYASLLAGYRWLATGSASLNGPHIGLAFRW